MVLFVAVLSLGATGVVPAAGESRARGEPPPADDGGLDVFGVEVDGPDVYSRQTIYVRLSVSARDGQDRVETFNIQPIYGDGWPDCVRNDASNPGDVQSRASAPTYAELSVTVVGGVFHRCGYERSQMRWQVRVPRNETGRVQLVKFPGERTVAVCGGGSDFFLCVRDEPQDNAMRVGCRGC